MRHLSLKFLNLYIQMNTRRKQKMYDTFMDIYNFDFDSFVFEMHYLVRNRTFQPEY